MEPTEERLGLAARLPRDVLLGTSSWAFPGWKGLVYEGAVDEAVLSSDGLEAYAAHPLFRCVGIDRSSYRPMVELDLRDHAEQVPPAFRFLMKAHDHCTLARFPPHARYAARAGQLNPTFLDAAYATEVVVGPALAGMGPKLGVVLFQFAPQEAGLMGGSEAFPERLHRFIEALPRGPLYAVELRNRGLLTPRYGEALGSVGAVHAYSVWTGMPDVLEQERIVPLRSMRALVARWMLPSGGDYETLKARFAPFDRLQAIDEPVRASLLELVRKAVALGKRSMVIVSNKAEGCAPLAVEALARSLADPG